MFAVLGLLAAVEGAGSLLYHAGDGGQFLHDVALGAVLGFVAGWHLGRLTGAPTSARWPARRPRLSYRRRRA